MSNETQLLREALRKIKHEAVSLADAQVIALDALSAAVQPASGEAFDWPDRAVLSVMNQVGDGPYGEDDVKVTRHFLKIADEVRSQFAPPASQEQGGSVVLVGERVRALHRECATMDLHERCHECQAYASQEQAQPSK
jgi:hypothetical protein